MFLQNLVLLNNFLDIFNVSNSLIDCRGRGCGGRKLAHQNAHKTCRLAVSGVCTVTKISKNEKLFCKRRNLCFKLNVAKKKLLCRIGRKIAAKAYDLGYCLVEGGHILCKLRIVKAVIKYGKIPLCIHCFFL